MLGERIVDYGLSLPEQWLLQEVKKAAILPLVQAATELSDEDKPITEMPSLTYTPTTPSEISLAAALGVGAPWALSKAVGNPITLGRSAYLGFGPVAMPIMGLQDTLQTVAGPLVDPYYQAGERGYLESLGKGISRNIEQVSKAESELKEKYGLLGLPIQMAHGVMNPVTSTLYLGRSLKDWLMGPEGQNAAMSASDAVQRSLER